MKKGITVFDAEIAKLFPSCPPNIKAIINITNITSPPNIATIIKKLNNEAKISCNLFFTLKPPIEIKLAKFLSGLLWPKSDELIPKP